LEHVEAIRSALANDFYVDESMIREAILRGSTFNVLHKATMFKVDVFLAGGDQWSRLELSRARAQELDVPDGKAAVRFASPEDTLLHKLVWYRLDQEVSDRQWGDVLGIIKVQGAALDHHYMDHWATSLGVRDLLIRAIQQSGPGPAGERPA
jgi:hypothetical protein